MTSQQVTGTNILRRSGVLALATLFPMSGQFLLTWYMARFYGPVFLGAYGMIVTLIDIARVIYSSGIQSLIMRKLPRRKVPSGALVGTALVGSITLNAASTVLIIILVIALPSILGQSPDLVLAAIVAALAIIPEGISTTGNFVAIGTGREHYVTLTSFLLSITQAAASAVVLATGGHILHVSIVIVLSSTLRAGAYIWLLNRWSRPHHMKTNLRMLSAWTHLWSPFFWTGVLSTASHRLDVPLLTQFSGLEMTGIYTIALRLSRPLVLLRAAVFQGFFPGFVRLFDDDRHRGLGLIHDATRMISFTFNTAALVIMGAADPVVQWLYGSAFKPTACVLQIIVWGLPAFYADTLITSVLFAEGKERSILRIHGISLFAELVLGIALASLWDAKGMAIVYTIVRILNLAQIWLVLRKNHIQIGLSKAFLAPTLVALAMGLPLFLLTQQLPPLAQIAVGILGGLLYGAIGFGVGFIRLRDVSPLLRALRIRRDPSTSNQ